VTAASAALAALLVRAPLFAAMPRAVVERLAARAARRRVRRGQRVLARSDAALVAVVTGRLELCDGGAVIRSVVPPSVLGVSLAGGARASAELRAAEDAELVIVPADAVAAALRREPEAAVAAIAHLAGVIALSYQSLAFRNILTELRYASSPSPASCRGSPKRFTATRTTRLLRDMAPRTGASVGHLTSCSCKFVTYVVTTFRSPFTLAAAGRLVVPAPLVIGFQLSHAPSANVVW
jgi:CRP-like cAMP-binding protein